MRSSSRSHRSRSPSIPSKAASTPLDPQDSVMNLIRIMTMVEFHSINMYVKYITNMHVKCK